jgi:hypothetical protein
MIKKILFQELRVLFILLYLNFRLAVGFISLFHETKNYL